MRMLWIAAATLVCLAQIAATQENYLSWSHYRNIVLNTKASGANAGTAGSPAMIHFPVLVRLSGKASGGGNAFDSIVMAQAAANGADVRFSKWDGAHFAFQRQRWDAANQLAEFWVLVDTVWGADSVNATSYPGGYLKMFWGKSGAADSSNGAAVFDTSATPPAGTAGNMWGGGYQAVFHLSDTTDATWNGKTYPQYYNLTRASATLITSATAMVGLGDSLTGAANSWLADNIRNPSTLAPYVTDKLNFPNGGPYTISAWAYPTKLPGTTVFLVGTGSEYYRLTEDNPKWDIADFNSSTSSTACGFINCDGPTPVVNTWYHLVGVRTNTQGTSPAYACSLYVNGVLSSTTLATSGKSQVRNATAPDLCIGADSSSNYYMFYGIINEVEVASVARSAAWAKLSYKNQKQAPIGSGVDSLTIRGPDFGTAPAIASYSANPATYITGMPITPNTPSVTGVSPDTFTVSPGLPGGLSLNGSTGVITGAASSSQTPQSYTVTVRNGAGSASVGLQITVNNAPPAITGQPVNTTVAEGGNAKFIVTVTGTPPMNYVWTDNNSTIVKSDMTMNVSDTLTIPNDSARNYGASYTCTITNSMSTAGPTTAAFLYVAIAPTLVSPLNNAFGIAQSPTLSWNTVAGAAMYYLQISTSNTFGVNAIYDSGATPPKTETVALGAVYYWRVQSRLNGVGSLWSNSGGSPWQFTTVPAAPALSSPVNTAVEVSISPTLTWNTVTSATKYWIQITTDATFNSFTGGFSDSSPTAGGYSPLLTNGTTYYWRVAATNGGGAWGAWSAAWSFYTTEDYASGWTGSRVIGFNTRGAATGGGNAGAGVATTQKKFPVLVRLTDSDLAGMSGVQANGSDIRFTNANGVHLPLQIETFNAGTGAAIWVLADSVKGNAADQYITMLWGNSAGVPGISRGFTVFDTANGFAAVYHLGEATGHASDATANADTASPSIAPTMTTGMIGNAQSFTGAASPLDYYSAGSPPPFNMSATNTFTLSAWVNHTANGNQGVEEIAAKYFYVPGNYRCYELTYDHANTYFTFHISSDGTTGTETVLDGPVVTNTNTWYFVAGTMDGSNMRLYQNGAPAGSAAKTTVYNSVSSPFEIGGGSDASKTFDGIIDEVVLSKVARPADWIRLSYENQQATDSLTYKTAPSSVTYRSSTLNLTMLSAMTPDTPVTVTGVVSQYSVSPPLPSGLSLNSVTGIISGTPAGASGATGYVITASNPIGSVQTSITISVAYATPYAPVLLLPADNAVNVALTPKLSWNANAGATGYRVQVSSSASFTPTVIDSSLSAASDSITAALPTSAKYYWRVNASNPGGTSAWVMDSFTTTSIVAPAQPVLSQPADNAAGVALAPKLGWNSVAGASSYHVQLSSAATFAVVTIDSTLSATSDSVILSLAMGAKYYWRVNASNTGGTSAWAVDSFTTVLNIAIGVKNGWNVISLNIHAQDSLTADVIGALKGFVLAKTLTQFYWPAQGLDGFDTLHTIQGYQMFCDSADTIHASGIPVNVAATPISMTAGWNMIAYLPQAAIGVDTATAAIASQLVLVKNSAGQVYWPDTNYNLNSIGRMQPGQGYQIYMTAAAAFTYPSGSGAKRLALGKGENVYLPAPKHFALALNTGSNATIVSRRVGINGTIAPDSSEVGVFDGKGNLVGAGVVMRGAAAFSVWGRSEQIKVAAGLAASEPMSFRLWNGKREYPLEFHGSAPAAYAKDGIFIGNFVVPSALFINKFALANAYPNPFRENVRIYFDVPATAGNAPQEVRIDVYDLRGSVVARLAEGKFNAGHYSVAWDGGNASALGSNMYIVEMKANNFEKKLRLFRVK